MSKTIDERIIQMRFENGEFERNAKTSMSTLDRLKSALRFDNAKNGLDDLQKASNNFSLGNISKGIDELNNKFSQFGIFATRHIQQLADSIWNAGTRMVNALTIEPVSTGFQEYETQIGAIQTILANTSDAGKTLGDVTAALDELNLYADKTIYNFTEMTRNIGTFTAAGVDLDTSVDAIKGIANLAAVSGSNSEQASRAMYQLSQALSAGTLKLQDWNSVVNAGMGGQIFQESLKETARVHGVLIDEMIEDEGSFRESLQHGWITTAILTETLQKFTGDLTEAQLAEIGYTEEQIEHIIKMGDMANDAATKVRTFKQLIDTLKEAAQSGWTNSWEYIIGNFDEATDLLTDISYAVGGVIDRTSEMRNNFLDETLSSYWNKFIAKVNEAGLSTADFEYTLREVATNAGIDIDELVDKYGSIQNIFKNGALSTDILIESLSDLKWELYDLSGMDYVFNLSGVDENVKRIQQVLMDLGYDIGEAGVDGILGSFTDEAIRLFQSNVGLTPNGIIDEETIRRLETAGNLSGELSLEIGDLIYNLDKLGGREKIIESFKNIFAYIGKIMSPIKESFLEAFNAPYAEKFTNFIDRFYDFTSNLSVSDRTLNKIKRTFDGLFSVVKLLGKSLGVAGSALKSVASSGIVGYFTDKILSMASAVGDFFVYLNQNEDVNKFFNGIKEKVDWVVGFVKTKLKELNLKIPKMNGLQESLNKLSAWLSEHKLNIPFMDTLKTKMEKLKEYFNDPDLRYPIFTIIKDEIKQFFDDISKIEIKIPSFDFLKRKDSGNGGGLFSGIIEKLKSFFKPMLENWFGLKTLIDAVGKGIDERINYLGDLFTRMGDSIVSFLNNLPLDQMTKGIIALAKLIRAYASIGVGKGVRDIGKSALNISGMFDAIGKSFTSISKSVDKYLKNKNKPQDTIGTMFLKIAASLIIIAKAVQMLSAINTPDNPMLLETTLFYLADIAVGMVAVVGILMALNKHYSDADLKGIGMAMLGISASVLILAYAVEKIGNLEWDQLSRGLALAAGAIVAMGAAFSMMGKSKFSAKGAGTALAILAMAAAVHILYGAVVKFSKMKFGDMVQGLIGVGVALFAITKALSKIGDSRIGAGTALAIIALVGGLELLLIPIISYSKLPTETLINGGLKTAAVLLVFAKVLQQVGKAKLGIGSALAIGAMAASLWILKGALSTFGKMKGSELVKGVLAVVILLKGLSSAMQSMNNGSKWDTIGVLAMAITLGVITKCIIELSKIDAKTALVSVLEICAVMLAFGYSMKLMSGSVMTPTVIADMAIMGLIVAGLAYVLTMLKDLPVDSVLVNAAAISGLALSLAGTIAIMSSIKFQDAMQGLGSMIGWVVGFAAFASIIGAVLWLVDYFLGEGAVDQIYKFFEKGNGLLAIIGEGIGNFIGNLLGSAFESSSEGIGRGLEVFADSLAYFMTTIGAVSSLDNVLGTLGSLGAAIVAFLSVELLELLDNLDLIGAATDMATGTNKFERFASKLGVLGDGIKEFVERMSGTDQTDVETATNAMAMISAVAKGIPNEGGLLGAIVGDNDIGIFAKELPMVGVCLKAFAVNAKGLDQESVNTAGWAMSMLIKFSRKIPRSGGLWGKIAGDNDIGKFGDKLPGLGLGLKEFAENVSGLTEDDIKAGLAASELIRQFAMQEMPRNDGFLGWLLGGEGDLGTFGEQLGDFGPGMKTFAESVKGIKIVDFAKAVKASSYIVKLSNSLVAADEDGFYVGQKIAGFGEALVTFGASLDTFHTYITGGEKISNINLYTIALDDLAQKGEALGKLDSSNFQQFSKDIGKYSGDVKDALKKMTEAFKESGDNSIKSLANALYMGNESVYYSSSSLAMSAVRGMSSRSNDFFTIGHNASIGFANGIYNGTNNVITAAQIVAGHAVNAMARRLDVHSPSKEMEKIGRFGSQGFINGLVALVPEVISSADTIADSFLKTLSLASSEIDYIASDQFEYHPTITPVLDFTEIETGRVMIDEMFRRNGSPLYGLPGFNRNGLSQMLNGVTVGSDNTQVVNEIAALRRDMRQMAQSISQMQVVLDSGSLVGGIIEPLDMELGARAIRRGRGGI